MRIFWGNFSFLYVFGEFEVQNQILGLLNISDI